MNYKFLLLTIGLSTLIAPAYAQNLTQTRKECYPAAFQHSSGLTPNPLVAKNGRVFTDKQRNEAIRKSSEKWCNEKYKQ